MVGLIKVIQVKSFNFGKYIGGCYFCKVLKLSKNNEENSKLKEIDQGLILKRFLFVSFAIHALVFLVRIDDWFPESKPIMEELVIEAELMPDLNMDGAKDDALPNAAKAEEIKVIKQILPQLPKVFELEKKVEEKKEDALAEEEVDKSKKYEEEQPKPLEEKEKSNESEVAKNEVNKDAMKIKKKEALERLLKEAARKEEKFADQTSAPLSKKLAQRKEELESQDDGSSGGGGISGIRMNKYRKALYRAIKRNYSVPAAYNLQNAEIVAKISIVLNASGDVREIKVHESSGDEAYDYLALKAVKDSVPLPKPPKEQAGKMIIISFNPRTF